jgi:DHA1 family bicyclomycin/chloramphenicol resistance-like MFS transporter
VIALNFTPTRQPGLVEFTLLIAALTSILALGIDAVLPAMPGMAMELSLRDVNSIQLVITYYLLGMGAGQILFGPASDSFGRKPVIFAGMGLFVIGSLICAGAHDFDTLLIGRLVQGLGVAAPRAVTMSMVRDLYEGREMAKVMSVVSAVFILVPAVAPTLGVAILALGSWRMIFLFILLVGGLTVAWLSLRQPETLPPTNRRAFRLSTILSGIFEVMSKRESIGTILASGISTGALFGYLGASQQLFAQAFDQADNFPYLFGALALAIGVASVVNASLVMRYGMRFLSRNAALFSTIISLVYLIAYLTLPIQSMLLPFMIWGLCVFFCLGIMFGNIMSIGMAPLGHLAGVGAAVLGSLTTVLSAAIGSPIGQAFNGTALPIILGFVVLHAITYLIIRYMLNAPDPI